ncbi:MAG: hypothetical protein AAF630_16295 [Cyanobacteria bacterium P01_C01_bin.38]
MFNLKLLKGLATTALTISVITLSFGCEKAAEDNIADATSDATKKVDFKVNIASGLHEGKTLTGSYAYTPDFELTDINLKGFDDKDISEYCNKLKVEKEDGLGLHGTCNTPNATYIFGDDSSGRGHVVNPFDYSIKDREGGDGGGIVEYN